MFKSCINILIIQTTLLIFHYSSDLQVSSPAKTLSNFTMEPKVSWQLQSTVTYKTEISIIQNVILCHISY